VITPVARTQRRSQGPERPWHLPTMTISDASVAEGNSGTTNCTFNVVLSQAASQNVTVQYATANGSATLADNDYQSASNTLTISRGGRPVGQSR